MDGTLVNTALVSVAACQTVSEIYNMQHKEPRDIIKLIGYPDEEFYKRLYPEYDKELLSKYSHEVEKTENELMRNLGPEVLFEGVKELIQGLKQEGFYLAIASTGSENHVDTALRVSEIITFFDEIRCNSSNKNRMVKEITDNSNKNEWIIVGDKQIDRDAGYNNNIITVAARYGFGSAADYDLFDYGIDYPLQLFSLMTDEPSPCPVEL